MPIWGLEHPVSSSHLGAGGDGSETEASASLQLTVSLGKSRRAESEGMAMEKPLSLGERGAVEGWWRMELTWG